MCSRRISKIQEKSFIELSQSGTPLRQTTITESFQNSKQKIVKKMIKLEKPLTVSNFIVISSDSDSDTEGSKQCPVRDAPSPPKKPKTSIGVNRPNRLSMCTSTIKNFSIKKECKSSIPDIYGEVTEPFPFSLTTPPTEHLNAVEDHIIKKINNPEEILLMNDPNNFEEIIQHSECYSSRNEKENKPITQPTVETSLTDKPNKRKSSKRKHETLHVGKSVNQAPLLDKTLDQTIGTNQVLPILPTESNIISKPTLQNEGPIGNDANKITANDQVLLQTEQKKDNLSKIVENLKNKRKADTNKTLPKTVESETIMNNVGKPSVIKSPPKIMISSSGWRSKCKLKNPEKGDTSKNNESLQRVNNSPYSQVPGETLQDTFPLILKSIGLSDKLQQNGIIIESVKPTCSNSLNNKFLNGAATSTKKKREKKKLEQDKKQEQEGSSHKNVCNNVPSQCINYLPHTSTPKKTLQDASSLTTLKSMSLSDGLVQNGITIKSVQPNCPTSLNISLNGATSTKKKRDKEKLKQGKKQEQEDRSHKNVSINEPSQCINNLPHTSTPNKTLQDTSLLTASKSTGLTDGLPQNGITIKSVQRNCPTSLNNSLATSTKKKRGKEKMIKQDQKQEQEDSSHKNVSNNDTSQCINKLPHTLTPKKTLQDTSSLTASKLMGISDGLQHNGITIKSVQPTCPTSLNNSLVTSTKKKRGKEKMIKQDQKQEQSSHKNVSNNDTLCINKLPHTLTQKMTLQDTSLLTVSKSMGISDGLLQNGITIKSVQPNCPTSLNNSHDGVTTLSTSLSNYGVLKKFRAKEGKRLQTKQLNELVNLFRMVSEDPHLRSLQNPSEKSILRKFHDMEDDKQYVVMKLFIWKRTWYNIFKFLQTAKIVVDDDKDVTDIFEYLKEENFVDTDYSSAGDLSDLLQLLDAKKIKEIMTELKVKPISPTKEANVQHLLSLCRTQSTLTFAKSFKDILLYKINMKMGFCIKIREDICEAFFNTYLLATFANRDFFEIKDYFRNIIDLDATFPETTVENYPVFSSRENFLQYLLAIKMLRELQDVEGQKLDQKCRSTHDIAVNAYGKLQELDIDDDDFYIPVPHLKRFSAKHVFISILTKCCENIFTKKNGHPNDVKKWVEYLIRKFPNSGRLGVWYYRLIILHMRHLDVINFKTAAELLIDILRKIEPPIGEKIKYELGMLGKQLKSSKKFKLDQMYHDTIVQMSPRKINTTEFPQKEIDSRCIRSDKPGYKRKYIAKNNQETVISNVEEVALQYYNENGYPDGEICEGSLIHALFMLFFWDIIYYPVNKMGIFISKFQTAPLDMFTPYFYKNRQELIDQRLTEIDHEWSDEDLVEFAVSNWNEHSNKRGAFRIGINNITVEVLITVIGRKILAKIFERLIKDLREYSSGFPDLLVWNVENKLCKFVEVKGESDKLRVNQILWLKYLNDIGANIEVCWVHSMGSKRRKMPKTEEEPPAEV